MLNPLPFELSQAEFHHLNRLRFDARGRAIEIVKLYFGRQQREIEFGSSDEPGIDLFVIAAGQPTFPIQVRGMKRNEIAWAELRITSEASFLRLTREKVPIFLVVAIYKRQPRIYRLVCGKDFDLVPEPQWRVRARDVLLDAVPSGVDHPFAAPGNSRESA